MVAAPYNESVSCSDHSIIEQPVSSEGSILDYFQAGDNVQSDQPIPEVMSVMAMFH